MHHLNTGEDGGYLKCAEPMCYVGPIAGKLSTFQPYLPKRPQGCSDRYLNGLPATDDLISPVGISAHRNEEGGAPPVRITLRPRQPVKAAVLIIAWSRRPYQAPIGARMLTQLSTAQLLILVGTNLGIMALMGISAVMGYMAGRRGAR